MPDHQIRIQQQKLTSWIFTQKRRDYLRDIRVSKRDKIVRRASGGSCGGAFLNTMPYNAHLTFSSHVFKRIVRWRLGLPFDFTQFPCNFDHNHRGPCDQDACGDHIFQCRGWNGSRKETHDAVRDTIIEHLKSIGLTTMREPTFLPLISHQHRTTIERSLTTHDDTLRNMGPDGAVKFGSGVGATHTFDFTHSHPIPSDENSVEFDRNVFLNHVGLREVEQEKRRRYLDIIVQGGRMVPPTKFVPLVTFTFGREGKRFKEFVKFIGSNYVLQKYGIGPSEESGMRLRQRAINDIWRQVSCALMKGNDQILTNAERETYCAQRQLTSRSVGRASNLLIRPSI